MLLLTSALAVLAGTAQSDTACGDVWYSEYRARPLERRFVMETVRVSPRSELYYELSLAPCGARLCPMEVRLVEDGAVHDVLSLHQCAVAEAPSLSDEDQLQGVGDPMAPDRGLILWQSNWHSGYDGFGQSTVARPMDLAPGLRGLLVHVREGFEEPSTSHELIVAVGKRLRRAWSAGGSGYDKLAWVDVRPLASAGGHEAIHFLRSRTSPFPYDERLESLEAGVYRWNPTRKRIERLTVAQAGVTIHAVIAGIFDVPGEAADRGKRWAEREECWPWDTGFSLVLTHRFPQLQPHKFMRAAFTWRRELAEKALAAMRSCPSAGRGYLAELFFFPAPEEW